MEGYPPAPVSGHENDRSGSERASLEKWAGRYDYGQAGGCWLAIRLDAGNDAEPLSAATPEELDAAIAADWAAR